MRALTLLERETIADPQGFWTFVFMRVTNYDGTWINLGTIAIGEGTEDFLNSATFSDDIDRNTLTVTATFRREVGSASLVPFRTDSPINVDDADAYQPLLDLHRQWDAWVCITPRGVMPSGEGDFREYARGIVDRIDIAGEPATITVQGRGPEADLIDKLIYDVPVTFGGDTIGNTLQAMLDDQFGPGVYTIVLDASAPSAFINEWEQTEEIGFWDLFSRTAAIRGANVRFLYDASDNLELTLFTPDRTAVAGDEVWVWPPGEYEKSDVGIDLAGIRNFAILKYLKTDGSIGTVTSPLAGVSASILRYGERAIPMTVAEPLDDADAQAFADNVVSDLELPIMEHTVSGSGVWFGGLFDYVKLPANTVQYDEDQYGGVTGYSHTFQNGVLSATYALRGKPAGRYATWLQLAGGTTTTPVAPSVISSSATFRENVVGALSFNYIDFVATFNETTQSAKVDVYDNPDFTGTLYDTMEYTVTPGAALSDSFNGIAGLPRDLTYVLKITPYTGPLVAGAVTGTAGDFATANTSNLPAFVDSPTASFDLSTPGEVKVNVAPILGGGIDLSGAANGDLFIVVDNGVDLEVQQLPIPSDWASTEYVLGIVSGLPAWRPTASPPILTAGLFPATTLYPSTSRFPEA